MSQPPPPPPTQPPSSSSPVSHHAHTIPNTTQHTPPRHTSSSPHTTHSNHHTSSSLLSFTDSGTLPSLKPPKILLPCFDGLNVLERIDQAEQYFEYHSITDENRIPWIRFYMKDKALKWFTWMKKNHQLTTWSNMCRALELRFGGAQGD